MSDHKNNENKNENVNVVNVDEHKGLTKPLINNIGGMIDQDAPSADQMLGGQAESALDEAGRVDDGRIENTVSDQDAVMRRPVGTPLGMPQDTQTRTRD